MDVVGLIGLNTLILELTVTLYNKINAKEKEQRKKARKQESAMEHKYLKKKVHCDTRNSCYYSTPTIDLQYIGNGGINF